MRFDLLVPLGLLALLTIPVLILIYIIRPNYQVKHVSSTYVWQLSLKYKKRKIPINKLRNILIFLCQLLILTSIAFIVARPALAYNRNTDRSDVIAIIDSSASMYTEANGETRFLRAVNSVEELADDVLTEDGTLSVILADDKPEFIATRMDRTNRGSLMEILEGLKEETSCSYGSSDIDGAIGLCEDIFADDPTAKIYLYTDTQYTYYADDIITIVPVSDGGEWNAAILNAEAELDDGYYSLTVEVACYGTERELEVEVKVNGANATLDSSGKTVPLKQTVFCSGDRTQTIVFRKGGGEDTDGYSYVDLQETDAFTSYNSIDINIEESDSYGQDNSYHIYGGRKEVVNLLYCSAEPNPFFSSALDILRNRFMGVWDIRVTEVRHEDRDAFITSGYDFYIYEDAMPDVLPIDGVVFLSAPDKAPAGAGFSVMATPQTYTESMYLSAEEDHPIMSNIKASEITVTRYALLTLSADYHMLMSCDTNPLLLLRDEGRTKILLMPFSVHYSNIAALPEWYTLLYNAMNFFLPGTVHGNSFEVGEQVVASPRGPTLKVTDMNKNVFGTYEREQGALAFTVPLVFTIPGTYELEQTSYFDENYHGKLNIFVKAPAVESNIWRVEDVLAEPVIEQRPENTVNELLVWFAVALVSLLFIEWILHSLENR